MGVELFGYIYLYKWINMCVYMNVDLTKYA